MKKSPNKPLGKNKFYNVYKGKRDNSYFFVLPSISISPKKILNWEMSMFCIFLAWGRYFVQFNICETVKNTDTEVYKENMLGLMHILKSENMSISDVQATLDYLAKNPYLINILKNANLDHPYVKSIFINQLHTLPFIKHNSNVASPVQVRKDSNYKEL